MVSCGNLGEIGGDYKDGIVITLKGAGAVTKADTPTPKAGVDTLNENKVASLCYFIYDASGSLLHSGNQSFSPALTITEPTAIRLNVSEEEFDAIFTTARPTVKMYLVANVDASKFSGLSAKSDIQAVEVAIQNGGAKQDNFVMSGEGDVSKTTDGTIFKATGSVDLTRSLAKISFNLNIRSYYAEIDGHEYIPGPGGNEGTIDVPIDFDPTDPSDYTQYWTPQYANMVVTFHNGAQNGTVAGTPLASPTLFDLTGSYNTTPDETDGTNYIDKFNGKLPYYTYARTWEEYQPSAAAGDTQPYFLIMLPWKKYGESDFQNTWYKIVLNSHEFVANAWYNITVALNGLGSLTNGEPVEVYPLTFEVGSWRESVLSDTAYNTVSEVQSDEVRVLALSKHEVTLYNENTTSVQFTSTHAVEIESVTLMQYDYSSINVTSSTVPVTNFSSLVQINGDKLVFNHTLNNDLSNKNVDFKTYYYTIKIRHTDDHSYTEELKVTQYPAMTIVSELTQGHQSGSTWDPYYLFVNGNTDDRNRWDTVEGTDATSNNRNMYVITVSQFATGSQMEIGDPRSTTPLTASGIGITGTSPAPANAPALYGTSPRTLTYYYQTSTSSADEYKVAPKFRFCSAYGQLGSNRLSLADAKKRCAGYQEDGYPAGRWRLPSTGELLFIANICAKGLIPPLFSTGVSYWTATGAYEYSQSNGGSVTKIQNPGNSYYSRCVYDEWYWENTDEMVTNTSYPTTGGRIAQSQWGTFVWGDMPM